MLKTLFATSATFSARGTLLTYFTIVTNTYLSLSLALPASTLPIPTPPPTQSTSVAPPLLTSSKPTTRLPLPFQSPRSPPATFFALKTPPLISSALRSVVPSLRYPPTSPIPSAQRLSPLPKPPISKSCKLSMSLSRPVLRTMLAATPSPPIRLSSSSISAAPAAMPPW